MTAAYAAFANQGEVPKPITIRRVEDRDGRVLFTAEESSTQAISPTTAFLMSTMLADVVNAGTAARARSLGFSLPAAGTTGTTNDFKDAWFIGFTPSLIAGVWVGFDQPRTIVRNGFAGDVAVPIWASFMKTATRGEKPQYFKAPAGVTTASVCRLSGKLANEGCDDVEVVDERGALTHRSMVYTEYFAKDTVPVEVCDLHRARRGFFGAVASVFHEGSEGGAPARVEDTGVPPAGASASAASQAGAVDTSTVAPPEPPKKKRGFWSRVFGIGKDDESDSKSSRKKDKNER
jgi:penicillin-binding protein 1A